MSERRYSDADVRRVFERALTSDAKNGIAHDELLAAAAEIGISRSAIDAAIADLDQGHEREAIRDDLLGSRRRAFRSHFWAFSAVNAFLFAINYLTTPHTWWALFPLLSWGLILFFHARVGLSSQIKEKAIDRVLDKRAKAERALERKLARQKKVERFEQTASELGSAAERGATLLVNKLAEEIKKATAHSSRMPSDQRTPSGLGAGRVRVKEATRPDTRGPWSAPGAAWRAPDSHQEREAQEREVRAEQEAYGDTEFAPGRKRRR